MRYRSVFVVSLTVFSALAQSGPTAPVPSEVRTALDGIQASSLRDDLSYIASDKLEGRDSPSAGLDLAADYIAAQFRRAGLEPGVGDSYFQNASMLVEQTNYSNFELKVSAGDRELTATPKDAVLSVTAAVDLKDAPVFKLDLGDEAAVRHLTASQVEGKVVITEMEPRWRARYRSVSRILREGKAQLLILVDRKGITTRDLRPRRLVDSDESNAQAGVPRYASPRRTAHRPRCTTSSGCYAAPTRHCAILTCC
jgi:hypothetical protein